MSVEITSLWTSKPLSTSTSKPPRRVPRSANNSDSSWKTAYIDNWACLEPLNFNFTIFFNFWVQFVSSNWQLFQFLTANSDSTRNFVARTGWKCLESGIQVQNAQMVVVVYFRGGLTRKCWPLNFGFPAVWFRKWWFREVRELWRIHVHQISSKFMIVVP